MTTCHAAMAAVDLNRMSGKVVCSQCTYCSIRSALTIEVLE